MQPSAGCVRRQPLVWMQMLVAWSSWFPWRSSNQRRLAFDRARRRLRSIDRRRPATPRRRRAGRRPPLTLESNSIWSKERRRRASPCARVRAAATLRRSHRLAAYRGDVAVGEVSNAEFKQSRRSADCSDAADRRSFFDDGCNAPVLTCLVCCLSVTANTHTMR